jgi:hypothetical protein
MHAALATSLIRHFPSSPIGADRTLTLDVARGERVAFQAAFRTADEPRTVTASVEAPEGLTVCVRRVGYVPMPHLNTRVPRAEIDGADFLPGYVPDPLFPESTIVAGPWETQTFWLTVTVPTDLAPGTYPLTVTLQPDNGAAQTLEATVVVHPLVLSPRRDFPVTHWFYPDALCDWYKTELWEESFWTILAPYLDNLVTHGQDTLYVPVFTPPLDGVKRPTQLLGVTRTGERYQFDWTLVERWVRMALAHGIRYFEWTHLFTQWGVAHALRIYEGHGEGGTLLWAPETGATSETYRTFLSQFLPAFKEFLQAHDLMAQSFFHLSDEPHGEAHLANYRAAREVLRELAPWMPVMDALSEISFAQEGLTDIPVPVINHAPAFIAAGFPAWAYFCCSPRGAYLNRFLDTPLPKLRMSGWLFFRTQVRGFLHWGYNYWYKCQTSQLIDPFTVTDGLHWPGWAYGDTFMVYPGPDGPIDSLRWEVFAESLQDYALLQAAGVSPDDPLLAALHDYADFPKSAAWIAEARAAVLLHAG